MASPGPLRVSRTGSYLRWLKTTPINPPSLDGLEPDQRRAIVGCSARRLQATSHFWPGWRRWTVELRRRPPRSAQAETAGTRRPDPQPTWLPALNRARGILVVDRGSSAGRLPTFRPGSRTSAEAGGDRMAGSVSAGAELARRVLEDGSPPGPQRTLFAQLRCAAHRRCPRARPGSGPGRLSDAAIRFIDEANDLPDAGDDNGPNGDVPAAYGWRRRWARPGVICDELSVSALALNLPASGEGLTSGVANHRRCGELVG